MKQTQQLYALQVCEDKIKEVREELQKTQGAIDALHTQHAERQKEHEEAPKLLQNIHSEIKLKNLDAAALAEKQKSFQQKVSEGKLSSKDFSRAGKEMDVFKKQKGKLEEDILALLDKQEALKKKLANGDKDLSAWTEASETQVNEKRLALEGLKQILEEREKEKENISSEIPASYLKQFRELYDVMDGVAVSRVEEDACGGCFMGLSTGLVDKVKTHDDDVCFCDSCGRMLYCPQ
jgi:predicted  nucleic acid-binding Zn-ribbon protein